MTSPDAPRPLTPATEAGRTFLANFAPFLRPGLMRGDDIVAIEVEARQQGLDAARSASPDSPSSPRGFIKIRTPDDPGGWTATGDIVPGRTYQYISGDVAVILTWEGDPK